MTVASPVNQAPAVSLIEHRIGYIDDGIEGPLLICMGGVHGNEPAGTDALKRFFTSIERQRLEIRGRMIGLAGNPPALAKGVRFLDHDLNRIWKTEASLSYIND